MNDNKIKPFISVIIGKTIKARRTKLGISQYDLAECCGIDRSFISHVEIGKHEPSVSKIFCFMQVLGIKPSDFIRLVESEYEKAVKENPPDNEDDE